MIELILIGSELLYGQISDLNGAYLGKVLNDYGLTLKQITVVADNESDIFSALDNSISRSQFIFISGGLGPTLDDLTKQLLAKYFKKEIVESSEARKLTELHYKNFGRVWTPSLNFYHHFPKDFTPVLNETGLAPGILFEFKKDHFIMCGPGVPREFQAMLKGQYLPILKKVIGTKPMNKFVCRTFGIPEEKIFGEVMPDLWQTLENFGSVSSLPQTKGIGVDIIVKISETSEEQTKERSDELTKFLLDSKLSPHIWQIGELPIHELLVKKLIEKNITVSTAESCTGGNLAGLITDVAGSSAIFQGSIVAYHNDIKINHLGVNETTIKNHGAVSIETAKEMAEGILQKFQTTLAISTTGIAGPGGGTPEKPVGTVAIAVTYRGMTSSELFNFRGNREILKSRFAQMALLKALKAIE